MENQVARRRMNAIAGHFSAAADDISSAATNIFPMNCSSSLNSVIRRSDNRMYFARQSSCSQACFMRQASKEQVSSDQSSMPLKCAGSTSEVCSNALEAPCFSRPAKVEPSFPNLGVIQPMVQECKLAAPAPPKFARPNRRASELLRLCSRKKMHDSESSGSEWSPKMDVAESGHSFILVVELPGVNANDIRVEVSDQLLTVKGKNSTQLWRVASSNETVSSYHQREISVGRYQVAWPLPANVNKDNVYAEFVDGLLRITIPKL